MFDQSSVRVVMDSNGAGGEELGLAIERYTRLAIVAVTIGKLLEPGTIRTNSPDGPTYPPPPRVLFA